MIWPIDESKTNRTRREFVSAVVHGWFSCLISSSFVFEKNGVQIVDIVTLVLMRTTAKCFLCRILSIFIVGDTSPLVEFSVARTTHDVQHRLQKSSDGQKNPYIFLCTSRFHCDGHHVEVQDRSSAVRAAFVRQL